MTETQFEELSANMWPALQTVFYDNWVVRLAAGYTRRSNSVLALGSSRLAINAKVDYCEALYERHGLPCIFKLTDTNNELDSALVQRGYLAEAETFVLTLELNESLRILEPEPPTETWIAACFGLNQIDRRYIATALQLMNSNPFQTACFAIRERERVIATAFAVVDAEWAGVFDVAVEPAERRRGLGRRVVEGALAWATMQGASNAFLQVLSNNEPALKLYRGFAFEKTYRYWYRRQPTS